MNYRKARAKLLRKAKYLIFIPRRVTRNPGDVGSLVSDLFPIIPGKDWSTEFELLDLPSLIRGKYDEKVHHEADFYFFDENGNLLGNKMVNAGTKPRFTVNINEVVSFDFPTATTFAVFHKNVSVPIEIGTSLAAERGYTGYRFQKLPAKGYVHGNLDAIALTSHGLQKIGNKGILKRFYNLQHLLRGPAEYIFAITNPTSRQVRIKIEMKSGNENFEHFKRAKIPSGGIHFFTCNIQEHKTAQLRILSRLYLARPVVLRVTEQSMDIFHG